MRRLRLTPLAVVLAALLVAVGALALVSPRASLVAAIVLALVLLAVLLDRAPSREVDLFSLRGTRDPFAQETPPGELVGPHLGAREDSPSVRPPSPEVIDEGWRRERLRRQARDA